MAVFLITYDPKRYYIIPDGVEFDKVNPDKDALSDYEVSERKFGIQRRKMWNITQKERDEESK